jgi:hypothetical protein
MRKFPVCMILAIIFMALGPNYSVADVSVGVSADEDGIKEFHLAIGSHYGIARVDVERVREEPLSDDDIAVALFIANRTGRSPIRIAEMRRRGLSWMEITLQLGLNAGIFYVAFQSDPGPPYGNAYGYYKKHPRKKWGDIRLDDRDIINLVNLKILGEQYQVAPEKVVKMKKSGKSFSKINAELKQAKADKGKSKKANSKNSKKSGKGNKKDK